MADARPRGHGGALSRWNDRAALGTLAVAAEGSPAVPGRALGTDLSGVFAAAVESPWCYLEFGNVGWCRNAAAFDPALRSAAAKIAASELSQAGCGERAVMCRHGPGAEGLLTSARLLREARTNGALFLALPPNGPARNSINDQWSLLRALCGTSDATNCTGPGAAEAQFRTNAGTWPRVTGLLLIAVGLLGMMLLFGYVALRLLTAALLSLFYLLLVPGVVLTPALGERGRSVFRSWAGRLFGALLAKLLFAFLLGALLAVTSVVQSLEALGWWAQWLLLSAFWWATFLRRHQLLALPSDAISDARRARASRPLRGIRETFDTTRQAIEWRERRKEKRRRASSADAERSLDRDESGPSTRRTGAAAVSAPVGSHDDRQALRSLNTQAAAAPHELASALSRLARRSPRLEGIEREHRAALSRGEGRRAARLGVRRDSLAGDVAFDQAVVAAAARVSPAGDGATGRGRLAEHNRFLDLQAALPAAAAASGGSRRRDYPALAGLVDLSRGEYERLAPPSQRALRLEIDRELATRRSLTSPRPAEHSGGGAVTNGRGRFEDAARPARREHLDPTPFEAARALRQSFAAARGGDVPAEIPGDG